MDNVETARSIELWGSFEILMEFWVARNERKKNASGKQIIEDLHNEDYKFGDKESKTYLQQVKHYMNLISEMGYQTTGFVCYVTLRKVEKVA